MLSITCHEHGTAYYTYGKAVVHENAADDLRINSQVARGEDSEKITSLLLYTYDRQQRCYRNWYFSSLRNQQMYQSRASGMKHLVPPSSGDCDVVSGL
jgi:hypothetical protein